MHQMDARNSKYQRQQANLDQTNNIVIARRMIQQRFAILDEYDHGNT
jgi:hypothetical protein